MIEAGFQPNALQGPLDESNLLESLALLTRVLGHFPVDNEIKLWGKENPGFPCHSTFRRLGKKKDRLKRLISYGKHRGYSDVLSICTVELSRVMEKQAKATSVVTSKSKQIVGYVYLLKSGRFFKVGRTKALGRREYELGIQLPEKPIEIHYIKTDDPIGIEKYWHERFKDRRKNGEWFELTKDDLAAFKRRKFM